MNFLFFFFNLFILNSLLLFKIYKVKLENLLGYALFGHRNESSTAHNKVSLVVEIDPSVVPALLRVVFLHLIYRIKAHNYHKITI